MLVTALTRKRLSRHASARPDEDNLASDMFKVTEEMARTKLQEAAPAFSVKKLLQEAPLLPPCESEVAVNMGFWMNLEEACASSWRSSAMAPQTISAMIGIFWLAAPDPWLMSLVIQDPLELVGVR